MIFRLKRSYFDGISGGFALGWAYVGPSGPAAIEIVTKAGEVLARGVANEPRDDVEKAGIVPKGATCGFRIAVASELSKINQPLTITARLKNGRTLKGRPVKWRPDPLSKIKGQLEAIRGFCVEGWAAGPAGEPVDVTLFVDGAAVSTTTAERFRRDLLEAGCGNGCQAFRIALPDTIIQSGGRVWVSAVGEANPLPGGPITVPPPGLEQDRMAIEGVLDGVNEGRVTGWINDGRRPRYPRQVAVSINGIVSRGRASLADDGLCRFNINVDCGTLPEDVNVVHVTDAASGVALSNSPLPCVAGSDENTSFIQKVFMEIDNAAVTAGPQNAAAIGELLMMVINCGENSAKQPIRRFFDIKCELVRRLHSYGQAHVADEIERSILSDLHSLGPRAADLIEALPQLPFTNSDSKKSLADWLDTLPGPVQLQPAAIRLRLRGLSDAEDVVKNYRQLQNVGVRLLLEEADRLVAENALSVAAGLYEIVLAQPSAESN